MKSGPKIVKELSSSRSGAKENNSAALAQEPRDKKKVLPAEAAYLLVELKDSMTLLYFTLENLRGGPYDRRAYDPTVQKIQDLTRRIDGLMKKFLESFPNPC